MATMQVLVVVLSICLLIPDTNGAILIPEEVATIFSLIYSVIPPIKVGKDSRFGLGFRVGPNIDYQVIIELGPQTNTQPLGETESKRNAYFKENRRKTNTIKSSTPTTKFDGEHNEGTEKLELTTSTTEYNKFNITNSQDPNKTEQNISSTTTETTILNSSNVQNKNTADLPSL